MTKATDQCPFKHDDINTLFHVQPMPVEDLPTVCTCGEPLTYADEVAFVNEVKNPMPDQSTTLTTEQIREAFDLIEKHPLRLHEGSLIEVP